jgi:hypothetical protein
MSERCRHWMGLAMVAVLATGLVTTGTLHFGWPAWLASITSGQRVDPIAERLGGKLSSLSTSRWNSKARV